MGVPDDRDGDLDEAAKLLASAAAPPADLYREGPNSREFGRTVSRLAEMQTHDYMGEPHVAAAIPPSG